MQISFAIEALSALAQGTRLEAFRLLVRHGPDGLPVGGIAERLGVNMSTLSRHLAALERAGLVVARRQRRCIYYAADYGGARRLVSFLMEDCCQASPEICCEPATRVLDRLAADSRSCPSC